MDLRAPQASKNNNDVCYVRLRGWLQHRAARLERAQVASFLSMFPEECPNPRTACGNDSEVLASVGLCALCSNESGSRGPHSKQLVTTVMNRVTLQQTAGVALRQFRKQTAKGGRKFPAGVTLLRALPPTSKTAPKSWGSGANDVFKM